MLITTAKIIEWYLSIDPITLPSGIVFHSTFTAPLKEVRSLAKRDPRTGVHQENNISHSWMAAKGYLALIEQLGNAYKTDIDLVEANSFKRGLKMFSALNTEEIDILYGLRCSMFHDFAIVRNDGKPNYIFKVGPAGMATAFIHAAFRPWDGSTPTASNNLSECQTMVELNGIGDLFESIVLPKVISLAQAGNLSTRIPLPAFHLKYFWSIG